MYATKIKLNWQVKRDWSGWVSTPFPCVCEDGLALNKSERVVKSIVFLGGGLAHPFVVFEGWETTTVSIIGFPEIRTDVLNRIASAYTNGPNWGHRPSATTPSAISRSLEA